MAEAAKRQRRAVRQARVQVQGDMVDPDVAEQIPEEAEEHDVELQQDDVNDVEDRDLLQQMMEAAVGDEHLGEQDAVGSPVANAQSSSSSSSSRSSSSSSTRSASRVPDELPAAGARDVAEREGEAEPLQAAVERQHRPESFQWGVHGYFHFSYRPESDGGNKAAYHVVCKWHGKTGNTACSKQISFAAADEDVTLRRLKLWCLSAPLFEGKMQHQGGRGLRALTDADAAKTHAELDAAERALRAPPR